jgi:hypothetical protein
MGGLFAVVLPKTAPRIGTHLIRREIQNLSLASLDPDRVSFAAAWAEVATPRAEHVRWQSSAPSRMQRRDRTAGTAHNR